MSFATWDLYERSIEVPAGTVEVLAEVVVDGPRIELRDIAVYPRGPGRLNVSPSELLAWARLACDELAAAGFDELRVTGTRLSGSSRGPTVDLTIRLRTERS
ncbi:MAG: hypothetical protein ACKV2O_08935 [Acidimicrobiales bacterium]